jgi:hypothetical protein
MASVTSFTRLLRQHVEDFFTNWSTSDLPVHRKLARTFRNRAISLGNRGCCGHPGEPGC